jgi:hypothetical protein
MRRVWTVGLLVATLSSLTAPPAWAASLDDPNDTAGRLDVTFVWGRVRDSGGHFLKVRVETENRFPCRYMTSRTPNRIFVLIDDGNDGDIEVRGHFFCFNHRENWGFMYRGDEFSAFVHARHPDRRTLVARRILLEDFAVSDVGAIVVRSRDESTDPCTHQDPCFDRAPDVGALAIPGWG